MLITIMCHSYNCQTVDIFVDLDLDHDLDQSDL